MGKHSPESKEKKSGAWLSPAASLWNLKSRGENEAESCQARPDQRQARIPLERCKALGNEGVDRNKQGVLCS